MPPRHHFLRRAQVPLLAFVLVFAGLAPSALAATGGSDESPASRAQATEASNTREPTGDAALVTDSASEAAGRGSTPLEASGSSGDSSPDRDAGARDEGSDDSALSTRSGRRESGRPSLGREGDESAADEDDEPSVEPAVERVTSEVGDRARPVAEETTTAVGEAPGRALETVRGQARPVVAKAHENVEKAGAATKPVIDRARAIVGRGSELVRGYAPSRPPRGAAHAATTASGAPEPRVGASPREPRPASDGAGPVRLVTRAGERFLPKPATAASPPPARRRLASAALRARERGDREQAAPRQASSTRAPARPAMPGSVLIAPFEDPGSSHGSSPSPDGGLSSTSLLLGGAAATIAAFCLTAPSLLRRLPLSPALVRPVAFVSLLERPG